jgi:hypothetical protein
MLHVLQRLLGRAGPSLQAQPSGGAADHEDFGERSAVNVVAGRTVTITKIPLGLLHSRNLLSAPKR